MAWTGLICAAVFNCYFVFYSTVSFPTKGGYVHPYLTPMSLPRTLHVHNSGPSPMTITRASLGRTGQCQTSGFRISNCEKQFIVYPNKSRKIEIE